MIDGHRVFDAHVHLQPWDMLRPQTRAAMERGRSDVADVLAYQRDAAAFEAFLDAEGVDRALLVNYVAPRVMGFTEAVNDWIAAYARGRARLLPMGSVDPRRVADPAAEVARLARLGIRALKVHPPHQEIAANAYATEGLDAQRTFYEAAERLGLPVVVHTGTSVFPGARNRFANPMDLDDVAIDFPRLAIVAAHVGRPLWTDEAVFLARRHANVHLELSGIPPKRLLEYVPRLAEVADRAMFGTDWPSPGVRSIRRNVADFLALPLPDEARHRILWDNAARLYGVA